MIKDIKVQNENTKPNDGVLRKLHTDFPQCFTNEGKFDLDRFKQLIENEVDVTKEGYELNFLGKNYANLIASTETETVIQPDLEHNALPENAESQNIYISGDNLDALKHLLKSYSGSIKCIYIDPPYNTGNDGFVYNDKFSFTEEQIQTKLGVNEEKAKRILDLARRGSASHSAWLMFMATRLMLAKDLLKEDGVIFISIDDNEQANLKLLCDSVFGEENKLGILPTVMNLKGNNDEYAFAGTHEYTIVYAKDKETSLVGEFDIDDDVLEEWEEDEIGPYKKGANLKSTGVNAPREKRPNLYFPLYIDKENGTYSTTRVAISDVELYPITNGKEMSWRWGVDKFNKQKKDVIVSITDDSISIYKKQRPSLGEMPTAKPKSTFYKPQYSSGNGTSRIKELFGNKVFNNPKPIELLFDFLQIGASINQGLVLDFFSGSASMADAVMHYNMKQGKSISYIMVQIPEYTPYDSEARKAGFETIDQIGQERICRAAKRIKEEHPEYQGDLGFKHYTLQDVPQNTLDRLEIFDPNGFIGEEDILEKFGKETILETWCVKDGYGFGANKVELQLAKYNAYQCGSHLYFISGEDFDENSIIALIDKYNSDSAFNPQNIVLFGYSFGFTQVEMLKKNLNILKDSAKNLNINLDIRY